MSFGGFGLSAGDFYFIVKFIASVVESFRDIPQGAAQQYAAFSDELKLISGYLDRLPSEKNELTVLWTEYKTQCFDFVTKYSSLTISDGQVIARKRGQSPYDLLRDLRRQTQQVIDTVRWPLDARKDAIELQQKVVRIVQYASLDVGLQNHTSLARLGDLLKHVLVEQTECSAIVKAGLADIEDNLREIQHDMNPVHLSQGATLWQKIENVRIHPRTMVFLKNLVIPSPQPCPSEFTSKISKESSISPIAFANENGIPFVSLANESELDGFDFNQAVDYLSTLETIMSNHVMRQHGADSIITLIKHTCDTINIALVSIGHQKQELGYSENQAEPDHSLSEVLKCWDRFTKAAQYQCKRTRGTFSPPRTAQNPPGLSPAGLVDISEHSTLSEYHRTQYSIPPPSSRRSSTQSESWEDYSHLPRTPSMGSRSMSVSSAKSSSALSSRHWSARIIILNSSGKEYKWKHLLGNCTITVSHPNSSSDPSLEYFSSVDTRVGGKHYIHQGRVPYETDEGLDILSEGDYIPLLELESSHEDLRIVCKDQLPLNYAPERQPIYVLQNEKESLALQAEVLKLRINHRRVVFGAETKHIEHTKNNHKSCSLKFLRILQDSEGARSIIYWTVRCPITNKENYFDFVEWHRSEFKSISSKKDKLCAHLKFSDEVLESNEHKKRPSSSQSRRPSFFHRGTSSTNVSCEASNDDPLRSPFSLEAPTFSTSPPATTGVKATDTGLSTASTLTTASQTTITPNPRSKAKKSIQGLRIEFYTTRDRDQFIRRFENPTVNEMTRDEQPTSPGGKLE